MLLYETRKLKIANLKKILNSFAVQHLDGSNSDRWSFPICQLASYKHASRTTHIPLISNPIVQYRNPRFEQGKNI